MMDVQDKYGSHKIIKTLTLKQLTHDEQEYEKLKKEMESYMDCVLANYNLIADETININKRLINSEEKNQIWNLIESWS